MMTMMKKHNRRTTTTTRQVNTIIDIKIKSPKSRSLACVLSSHPIRLREIESKRAKPYILEREFSLHGAHTRTHTRSQICRGFFLKRRYLRRYKKSFNDILKHTLLMYANVCQTLNVKAQIIQYSNLPARRNWCGNPPSWLRW